jgi:hypothetical protein
MTRKHRRDDAPFTCSNRSYETNTARGRPHGEANERGSVFEEPLITNLDGGTLWLEYVIEKATATDTFWLMWYDSEGSPTIPLSGVFDSNQLREMVSRLAKHIELP